jgi:hypothetical protein
MRPGAAASRRQAPPRSALELSMELSMEFSIELSMELPMELPKECAAGDWCSHR